MNFIKNNLANAFTLGNLFCGCIAISSLLLYRDWDTALYALIGSLVLDFFDGFVARALKANSPLGVQLDSLADMVSFGFLPGVVAMLILKDAQYNSVLPYMEYLGFFITLLSCLRLAIFNLDEEQRYYFKGLNTPTNTVFVFGLAYAIQQQPNDFWQKETVFIAFAIISLLNSYLLISPIKMLNLKLKKWTLPNLLPHLSVAVITIISSFIIHWYCLPIGVLAYIIISLFLQKKLSRQHES